MIIRECKPEEWDNFVTGSPNGTLFSTSQWIGLFCKPYQIYGAYKNNELVGGIAGFIEEGQDTFKSWGSLTPFMGVLIKDTTGMNYPARCSLENEVATSLIEYLTREYRTIDITNHYTFTDIRPFLWNKFMPSVKYTYVLPLNDMEAVWFNIEKDTRYEINHAEKEGVEVETGTMREFLSVYNTMWKRKGMVSPQPDEFFLEMDRIIKPDILMVDSAVGTVMMHDNKRAYYILGASDAPNLSAYCLWEAIKQEYNNGIREIDFVGANNHDIALYKRGFGGQLTPYYEVKV